MSKIAQIGYCARTDSLISVDYGGTLCLGDLVTKSKRTICSTKSMVANKHYPDGYVGKMCSLAISQDCQWAVVGSKNGLWTIGLQSGECAPFITGHQDNAVRAAAISPAGEYFITGGYDLLCKVWHMNTHRLVFEFTEHLREPQPLHIQSLAFSPDGSRIASVSEGVCHVWDPLCGKQYLKLADCCMYAEFSPDGKYVLTTNRKQGIIYDLCSGKKVAEFSKHTGSINCLKYSLDGKTVCSGSHDKTAKIWDSKTADEIRILNYEDVVENIIWRKDQIIGLLKNGKLTGI